MSEARSIELKRISPHDTSSDARCGPNLPNHLFQRKLAMSSHNGEELKREMSVSERWKRRYRVPNDHLSLNKIARGCNKIERGDVDSIIHVPI